MTLGELRLLLAETLQGSELLAKSYFAGGAVRDYLLFGDKAELGLDVDIAVEAPEGGRLLAELIHERLNTTKPVVYNTFGTASVVWEGLNLEFVHTRRESYRQHDRKPEVSFGTLQEDALRRDFGINALYMRISDGGILDPSGKGLRDIESRVIACVDDPERVFSEDPLRLLRAIRFAARLGFEIEPRTYAAIVRDREQLAHISQERIAMEFEAMLLESDAQKVIAAIRLLAETGILTIILPEVDALRGLIQNKYHHLDAFEHTLLVLKNSEPTLIARWAALLHDIGKSRTKSYKADGSVTFIGHDKLGSTMAYELLKRFSVPKRAREIISMLVGGHMVFKQSGEEGLRIKDSTLLRLADRYKDDLWLLLDLVEADNSAHAPEYRMPEQVVRLRRRFAQLKANLPRFNLTGRDLLQEFDISTSKKVGELLQTAKQAWYEDPGLGKNQLLELLRPLVENDKEMS